MARTVRKGEVYKRTSDGYVFVVKSASRKCEGAYLHCLDATAVLGWFTFEKIAREFERLSREDARELAQRSYERWTDNDPNYWARATQTDVGMVKLCEDTITRNGG